MYVKAGSKRIKIKRLNKFPDRFKSFKFVLEPIDYGILIPKKKFVNTYMFCQRVDVCLTDRDDRIVALYENLKSEKLKLKFKSYNVYYLPLNTVKHLKIDDLFYAKEK